MVLANLGENLKENQDFRLLRGIWGSPRFFPFFVLFVLDMRERERERECVGVCFDFLHVERLFKKRQL